MRKYFALLAIKERRQISPMRGNLELAARSRSSRRGKEAEAKLTIANEIRLLTSAATAQSKEDGLLLKMAPFRSAGRRPERASRPFHPFFKQILTRALPVLPD